MVKGEKKAYGMNKKGQLYELRRDQSRFKHEQGTSDQSVYTNWQPLLPLYLV
jgi:hypothetical protein